MAKKILIIDDDAELREAMATLLRAKGYVVSTASDGQKGFEKAKQEPPNLIILDVMMAHKTEGYEVARSFRDDDKTKTIPIVMVTGVKREIDLGFDVKPDEYWLPVKAVLEKPVKPELLLKTVDQYILD